MPPARVGGARALQLRRRRRLAPPGSRGAGPRGQPGKSPQNGFGLLRHRPSEFGAELRALSRAVMRSYARYYLETFRLQIIPDERIRAGMHVNQENVDLTLEHMKNGRGVIYALPHMGDFEQAGRWVILVGAGSLTTVGRAAQAGVGVPEVPRVPPGPRDGSAADHRRPAPVRSDGTAAAGGKAGLHRRRQGPVGYRRRGGVLRREGAVPGRPGGPRRADRRGADAGRPAGSSARPSGPRTSTTRSRSPPRAAARRRPPP